MDCGSPMDTGAPLGEIVGLRVEDDFLDDAIPHIGIRPHTALGRTLKNASSERKVPLVGLALWAAKAALRGGAPAPPKTPKQPEVVASSKVAGWLFPRYAANEAIRATHASNTINKRLKVSLGIPKTSHSFRHAMRDRLRETGVPEDTKDAIGGWSSVDP